MLKKILCIMLATLILSGMFVSCSTVDEPEQETNDQTQAGSTVHEDTHESLDIPNIRYDGVELCFLTRDYAEWTTQEIFAESLTSESDNINNAVYERNDTILQNYGVTILEIKEDEQFSRVTNEVSAPTGDFQGIISSTSGAVSYSTNDYLWDLNSYAVEYMDFTKSWWDQNMAEGMSIDGRLYFATGDLLTSDNDATFILMFNKQIATECKIPDLYELVENGKWTLDKFYEFEQVAMQDIDGNGKLEFDTDICGLAYTSDVPYSMLFGGGVTICTKDADDCPIYQLDIERAQDISDKGKLIFSKDYTVDLNAAVGVSGLTMYEVGQKTFGEGHALFMGEVMQCVTRMRGLDVDFGILPYPKLNESQSNYYSMMHFTASCVSIPKSVNEDDIVMVNAIIEAMAYYAVDTLTEQYYEINLKTKGAKDEQSGPMIDMILSNRVYDLSYYYQWGNNAFGTLASCLLPGNTKAVSSHSKRFQGVVEKNIASLMDSMAKTDD